MSKAYEIAANTLPSSRQLEWQKTEFYGLIHFGMCNFLNREWSDGKTKAENFIPEAFSAEEWVQLCKSAGMKGVILNCKPHDGFCLWNTACTDYSVMNADNWDTDERDIVKLLSEQCRRYGLKFGISVSPLDRHEPLFGSGDEYNEHFKKLLAELLTNYGDIFCVRLDGSNEPSKDGKIQKYDWYGYYDVIRKLQPNAVISLCGPDVRWYGNEWGVCRKNEWSVVPKRFGIDEAIKNAEKPENKKAKDKMELDLGGRKFIKNDTEFIWYPAEVSVSIRESWYYHKSDDYSVKTKDKLLKLYYESVGANAALMLGISPDKDGKFPDIDTQILRSFGYDLEKMFSYEVSYDAKYSASSEYSPEYSVENLRSTGDDKTWRPADNDKHPEIIIELPEKDMFDKVVLMENIKNGQHVEEFELFVDEGNGKFKRYDKSGVVGYKHICKLRPMDVKRVKIVFKEFRGKLDMSSIIMY
ncbi:MAG: alpha-L-fucosidase [Clostridiales bacterium]|nr:alpha-L-fucosidase [Clostridiales bacterium]